MKSDIISKFATSFYKEHKDATVVYAKWICTCADEDCEEIITDGAIAFEKNKIIFVGTSAEVKEFCSSKNLNVKEIKLSSNQIIIPGLINCHCHLAMSLLRGYADDYNLQDWLTKFIWPTEQEMLGDDFVYYGTLISCIEALLSGTTMLNDSYFLPDSALKAIEATGIRCVLAEPLLDFGNNEVENQFQNCKKFIETIQKKVKEEASKDSDCLVRASINPHACYTVPEEWLLQLKQLQDEKNKENPEQPLICHIHLHETVKECEDYEDKHQKTALQTLVDVGLMNEHLVAAHCVHMTDEEIEIFKDAKASICHCPKSNLKLASGFADVGAMLDAGVNVCLGTDGAASNNSVNMISEMQVTALIHKALRQNPVAMKASAVLKMATRNGSKALGREKSLGSLEVGKLADFVAIDLAGKHNVGLPIYDPICHLVYSTHVKVTDVWINGKPILSKEKIHNIKLEPKKYEALVTKLQAKREYLMQNYIKEIAEKKQAEISKVETTASED